MSHFPEEPRFTIEQIDLLQRLRRSGMAKREILHALDTLERLEREHVQKFGHRHSYGGGEGGTEAGGASVQTGNSHGGSTSTSGGASSHAASSSKASVSTQTLFHRNALSPLSNNYETSPPPTVTMPMPMMAPPAQNGRDSMVPLSNGTLSPNQYPVSAAPVRAFGFEPTEEEVDIDDKVEELMRKDSNIVKEEIKAFLGTRRISQAVVAQVTGISQSRISHWLLQQGSDLSEQKKRAFYRWYQLEKTTPGATLAMRPAPMAIEDIVEWHQTGPPISCSPGSFRLRRGSRFTWRKECLAVMESYFNDNQYPDEAKREEIANACNAVIQKPGKKLSDLERVTSLKVYNWFANRRKEIKRRANIEAAILESHGLDVQSPGGQSNSDEIDGTEYSEPAAEQSLGPVPSLLPGWLAAWPGLNLSLGLGPGKAGNPKGAGPARQGGGAGQQAPEGSRLTAVSWSPSSPQDDGTGPSEHQDPITLAVEMAAVNHSILALAKQGRGMGTGTGTGMTAGTGTTNIKAEVLEDD
ncbi:homeobox-containing protein 1a isoform X6 [Astyanax mexicanus]|uniref:homeobox-containing protein 1a isoform X6 n=1 Tax=Astyanax mexicanus TaxID=7994 RepID=UPI0020CB612E|nr:homeobox-containing protein 1a isoform X6 [Astyanax mexicanus]